jgi:hypothetical protein
LTSFFFAAGKICPAAPVVENFQLLLKFSQQRENPTNHISANNCQLYCIFNMADVLLNDSQESLTNLSEDLNAGEDIVGQDGSIDGGQLIEVVRSFPILWNTKLRAYKETNKKNIAWNNVASQLKINGKFTDLST